MPKTTRTEPRWMAEARQLHQNYLDLVQMSQGRPIPEGVVPADYFQKLSAYHRLAQHFYRSGARIGNLAHGVFLSPPDPRGRRTQWQVAESKQVRRYAKI